MSLKGISLIGFLVILTLTVAKAYPEGETQSCDCHPIGSEDNLCEPRTGQCRCKPGYFGLKCDRCMPGLYGPECAPCACDIHGTVNPNCDVYVGQCACHHNFVGRKCDQCASGHNNYPLCTQQ